ncbi:MAG TPA: BTAD domain-containing putative transcriptional regulator [Actinomycetota bacterium]|nr:BTAD domain-containing putative transcriptional regulator [Actinomycetota bacterium]
MVEVRGDEALAVFRSSRQAMLAAVDLQLRFLEETRRHPDRPLPVGIGLDAGEAMPVRDGYRGGALNLAARLCGQAAAGETLCSQGIVHLTRKVDGVKYIARGELHLKGLSERVVVVAIASEDVDVVTQMRPFAPKSQPPHGRRLQFRILGSLEVDAGGGPIPLGGPKQRAVLAHLLIRANELVPADTLIERIWGEDAPPKARNTLQTYVSQLRKAIGPDRIQRQTPGYRLRLEPLELDADRFGKLLADARKARGMAPGVVASLLDEALELWRGAALSDIAAEGTLLPEAARLNELKLVASEERIDALLATGEQGRAIAQAEALVSHEPLRERIWGQLMLAHYREGRQADALQAYQRAREILADELGIDPSPELTRLHERILKQDPALELRGEPLRGYRLLEKIDDGPMGAVFRAIQPHVGRDVVVKIIHESIAADPGFIRRFEQEAQSVAALEHPHLVPVYDYWREPTGAYVASRYLRGGNLRALQERGGLDADRRAKILGQVCSGLAFAHKQGVAHGDVKSSDVLLDSEGNAYLGDFRIGVGSPPSPEEDVRGLARLLQGLFAADMPRHLAELTERAEIGADVPSADEFAEAARMAFETKADRLPVMDARNPYKGLRPFTEADAADFFGRGELVVRVLDRMRESSVGARFLAIVGPSGSGKSSVARAGVVPAIRRGALETETSPFVAEMFPGAHPIDELEAALLRIAVGPASRLADRLEGGSRGLLDAVDAAVPGDAEVVLLIDQFEEVFTMTLEEREREQFLESLRIAAVDPDSRLRIIVTLRADFFDRPLAYPRFGELLGSRTEVVPPLTPDEVEQAVRLPSEEVGVPAEPGLVAEMIADAASKPGALPLLQYALTELFERRDEGRLTLDAYREIDGVAGALSGRAERLYGASSADGRRAIKQVFLRLVTLGEGREDTRRRVARHEFDSLGLEPGPIAAAVDAYGRHRLLTFDREPATREPTVEIAHEAMLGAWSRLRRWIDETRDDLRQDRLLAASAGEWRASDRDPSFVLRGTRLEQFESWSTQTDLSIASTEREFLKASVDRREHERAEELARRANEERLERRSHSRLRTLVAVFAVALLVVSTLTVIAVRRGNEVSAQSRVAFARELAASSVANLEADPERSILLAIEAIDQTRSVDGSVLPVAREALHRAITASRVDLTVSGLGGSVAWSPRGVFVTEGPEGSGLIDIRDDRTGEHVFPPFRGHGGDITDVAFSPDGSTLATTGDDGTLRLWNPSTGDLLKTVSGEGTVWGPSFSADGSRLAAAWYGEGEVRILDPASGRVVQRVSRLARPTDVALDPRGRRIAVSVSGGTGVIDLGSGERIDLDVYSSRVSWSSDGRHIATVDPTSDTVDVWDAATGGLRSRLGGHTGPVASVAWSPVSRSILVSGGSDGTARVWDTTVDANAERWSFSAQGTTSGIVGVTFSPDGTRLLTGDADITTVKVWDLGRDGDAEWANLPTTFTYPDAEFMPDGQHVVAHTFIATVMVWDSETGRGRRIGPPLVPWTEFFAQWSFNVSPDGRSIATAGDDGSARVWNAATGEELFAISRHHGVTGVEWSPDGELLLTSGLDGTATIFDSSGSEIRVLPEGDGYRMYLARFSPDGRFVATVAEPAPGELRQFHVSIWDWERGEVVRTIDAEAWNDLVFDPSGRRIATVPRNGPPEVWDIETGGRVAVLELAGTAVKVAFSPDGSRIATGGVDGTVRLFDTVPWKQRLILRGHGGAISAIDFSRDGTKLASASVDETVRIWALAIDDLLELAGREVTRSLTDEECRQYLHVRDCASS